MRSRYQNRQSLKTLWRQFFQYGLWKIRVLQKHPRQMSARQFVPPLFVLAVVVTALAAPWLRSARWLLLAASRRLCGGAGRGRRHGRTRGMAGGSSPRVLAAFATMHLSWGSGFLVGAVRFARPLVCARAAAAAVAGRARRRR